MFTAFDNNIDMYKLIIILYYTIYIPKITFIFYQIESGGKPQYSLVFLNHHKIFPLNK